MAKAKRDIVQRNHLGQRVVVVPKGQEIPAGLKVDEKTGEAKRDPVIDRDDLDGMSRAELNAFAVGHGLSTAPDMGSKDEVVAAVKKAGLA